MVTGCYRSVDLGRSRWPLVLFLAIPLGLIAQMASACMCAGIPSMASQAARSEIVFTGVVTLTTGSDREGFARSALLSVDQMFKGPAGASDIWVHYTRSNCYDPFFEGQRYVVFGKCLFGVNRVEVAAATRCGGTSQISSDADFPDFPQISSPTVSFTFPRRYVGFFSLRYESRESDAESAPIDIYVPHSGIVELSSRPSRSCDTRFTWQAEASGTGVEQTVASEGILVPSDWVRFVRGHSRFEGEVLQIRDYYWLGPPERYRMPEAEPQPGNILPRSPR